MKKFIQFLFLILVIAIEANANNINKPISSQYGFIENKGQIIDQNNNPNPSVLYLYNGNGLRVQLRKEGFSYEVINTTKTPKNIIDERPQGKFASQADSFDITYQTHRVDINFKDGNKNATLKPYQPASDFINYYTTGTSEAGVTNVHHFQKVVYENVYPNIDIEFVLNDAANRGKFKYNFIVKPNGNLADIKLAFLGANRTSLNQAGNILIETAYGNIEENIPLSYVIKENNTHSNIKANFTALNNNTYGIKAENYNNNQTLVIDPTNWNTYFGGNGLEDGKAIATDMGGNIIITGGTNSTNAIATSGAHQTIIGVSNDCFIAKFNSNGTRLWASYYGGNGTDNGNGIAIDVSGNVIITGETYSTNAIASSGVHQSTLGGGSIDAFLVKFNTNGVRQWATYYGGSSQDYGYGITIDLNSNIIMIGQTSSTNAISTSGAHQSTNGGGSDAFVAKFSTNGIRQWATYYGGSSDDSGSGITIDGNGNIIVTGTTSSSNAIATVGAHQPINGGGSDVFIVKFNSNGARQWASYYGGSGNDYGRGIAVDLNSNILITGYTSSNNAIVTSGAHQTVKDNGWDAFIAKFNTNGIILWATYYGGGANDFGSGIATDTTGNVIIAGYTLSSNGIATIGAYQTTFGGTSNFDGFVANFTSNGTRLWSSYYGDSLSNLALGITTDVGGNIIITGWTNSTKVITSSGVHQTINGGYSDVFIAKFSNTGTLPVKLISFNATLANEKVNCAWETASEINNDYFTIERSKDGNGFEAVGNVKGQGNSNSNIRYSYTDNNPFSGISYYRLKQTDFDGKYTYSDIKKVGLDKELASKISLYYENNNPIISISSLVENKVAIELINLNGIKLFTIEQPIIKGENTFAIDGNITPGLYLLKVQMENEVKYFKVWMR